MKKIYTMLIMLALAVIFAGCNKEDSGSSVAISPEQEKVFGDIAGHKFQCKQWLREYMFIDFYKLYNKRKYFYKYDYMSDSVLCAIALGECLYVDLSKDTIDCYFYFNRDCTQIELIDKKKPESEFLVLDKPFKMTSDSTFTIYYSPFGYGFVKR